MAGLVGGGPPTMGQDMPWSPYDGPIRPHPGPRRPMTPQPMPPQPGPPGPQPQPPNPQPGPNPFPQPQPPNPQPGPNPFPQPPNPQPPGVPPTGGPTGGPPGIYDPMPSTRPTTPTMPATPTMPTGGGSQPMSPPMTGGGFGDVMGGGGGFDVSPMTPGGMGGPGGPGGMGGTGGGGYQPPTRGTGPITKNTWNIGGNTSTSITKGDEYAQKKPEKTFRKPKIAMGQKEIGDPRLAMQQLSAMQQTPFMRRA